MQINIFEQKTSLNIDIPDVDFSSTIPIDPTQKIKDIFPLLQQKTKKVDKAK